MIESHHYSKDRMCFPHTGTNHLKDQYTVTDVGLPYKKKKEESVVCFLGAIYTYRYSFMIKDTTQEQSHAENT